MYDLADVVADTEVDPGTNLLVAGPPMTGKRRLGLRILASGSRKGEGAIVVTTKDSASRMLNEFGKIAGDVTDAHLGIVDCVTQQQGGATEMDDERVRYAASPVDMTGIGIELSSFLQSFYGDQGIQRNRIMLHSLSTLLMYSDLQTVFRFLHVFTGRIDSADALGVFVVDSTAHDEQTNNTLKQLFDGVLHVEEGEDGGEPAVRLQGL